MNADEITPAALAKDLRAKIEAWTTDDHNGKDVFWLVNDVCDKRWGPPLVSDPKDVSNAKMYAVNAVRRALADEVGVAETWEIWQEKPPTKEEALEVLRRAVDRLEVGRYVRDKRTLRLVYHLGKP